MESMKARAMRYAARGWAVFPLVPRGKVPLIGKAEGGSGCHDATSDTATVDAWWDRWPDANIGLHCGPASGVWVLDIDAEPPAVDPGMPGLTGPDAIAAFEAVHGPLPETLTARTGGGGEHRYWRMPNGRVIRNRARIRGPAGERTALDVRAEGGYVVLPPSLHASGRAYEWVGTARQVAEAPAWLMDLVDPPRPVRSAPPVVVALANPSDARRWAEAALRAELAAIQSAGEKQQHDTIFRSAAAMGEIVAGGSIGRDEVEAALVGAGEAIGRRYKEVCRTVRDGLDKGGQNPRVPPPREERPRRRPAWESGPPEWLASTEPSWTIIEGAPPALPEERTYGAGADEAERRGIVSGEDGDDEAAAALNVGEEDRDGTEIVVDEAHRMTDLGNARRLMDLCGADLRWCGAMPGTGWMLWDGSRWRPDELRRVYRLASRVPDVWREEGMAIDAPDTVRKDDPPEVQAAAKRKRAILAHANRSESAAALKSMLELGTAEAAVARDRWDADPLLFNTPNTTLDLRRAVAYEPRRDDYLTKSAGVGVVVRAPCPTWLTFLDRIMGGDAEMVAFLQRAVGYCLTGSTSEQCMFIAHGSGANGKSTFMEAVRYILGDYARNTPVETFTGRREGGIPNDLAALAGARMVTCSEPADGAALNEGLVKLCTGDDVISARFLNREFFDYMPTFKVWMLTNHKPVIKGTDNGIWRRIRMLPFTVTIPVEERDQDLGRKLKAEAAGILQWAVDGCGDWRHGGLRPPASVIAATEAYRGEMDVVERFLEDRCQKGSQMLVRNDDLYAAFREWCVGMGEFVRSHRWLSRAMADKGYQQHNDRSRGRQWIGLTLSAPASVGDLGWRAVRGDA